MSSDNILFGGKGGREWKVVGRNCEERSIFGNNFEERRLFFKKSILGLCLSDYKSICYSV